MTVTQLPPFEHYDPPNVEVLGALTDLAEGAGEGGALIVMQTGGGIPGGGDTGSGTTVF